MDHKNYIAADRISELPDHLQQHIPSYLSINEVVQSSILSKRWKHVWTAVPVLGFMLCLVRVKAFPENILFSRNAIFRKGKCFHVFGCHKIHFTEN